MGDQSQDQVVGIPVNSVPGGGQFQRDSCDLHSKQKKAGLLFHWMNKFSKRADSFTQEIRNHVRLGPKISETVKGKLSLGARILRAGGVEKAFRRLFDISKGEKLLKASQCYLSTSAGPISGLLFTSTERVAFHSDRPLTISSSSGEVMRIPYKVVIPIAKVKRANPSQSMDKPRHKYIHMVTVDGFEFWFMGFLSYQRTFRCLQMAMLQLPLNFLPLQRRDIGYLCNRVGNIVH